jgi:hypothetical protein
MVPDRSGGLHFPSAPPSPTLPFIPKLTSPERLHFAFWFEFMLDFDLRLSDLLTDGFTTLH